SRLNEWLEPASLAVEPDAGERLLWVDCSPPCIVRKSAAVGGKPPLIQRYRIWPLLSHNPCSGPDRVAGYETARFHSFTRRRNGWVVIRRACAADGDAGDRFPQQRLAWFEYLAFGRVPSGTERSRLRRGPKFGGRIPLGGGPL